ncbi:RNA polymerase sigma factor [Filimonas zeae]|uniref:RNA polymerase sigma factor n=1 Tax=Filimonas zeae TaxID=1737353 RepID=UPI0021D0E4CD|nr:sigma-70 family RNA polymerase sigma factor [Filimonas zeae]
MLQQLSTGDERALRILYNEYYTSLVFFANSMIHDTAQAEDIVITAFTRYWDKRTQFEALAAIKAYLYTLVRNDCYKYYHREEARKKHLLAVMDTLPEEYVAYADSRMVIAEMVQQIHREIEQLNPKYRDVIYLLFVEELSIKETAYQLQISENNVRKRKERAIELLRSRIVRANLGNLVLFYLVIHGKTH